MRYFYVIIGGLASWAMSFTACAQEVATGGLPADSVWLDAGDDDRRVSSRTDSTGTCTEVLRWEQSPGVLRVYYPSGHLKEYVPYADLARGRRQGLATTWFDSGQLHTRQVFWSGQRTDTLLVYYETGALKRRSGYMAGNEHIGSCFGPDGQPVAYFPYEQLPLYPGGSAQLTKEITLALRLPRHIAAMASLMTLQMEVMLQIAEDGSIQAPQVARSSELAAVDQAVLVAISRLTRRFNPAQRDGQRVACAYFLPVRLALSAPFQGGAGR